MHFRHLLLRISLWLALLFAGRSAFAEPLRVYQIGNSWTCLNQGAWDIAQSLSSPNTHGQHIAWNQTLKSLWAGAHDFSSPCPFNTCLTTQPWDIVTMQPWYETWVEASTAATSMANLAFAANPNTKILIFACGPESSQGPYLTTWNRTDEVNYTQANFWKSKRNYEMIVNQLRTNFPGKKIGVIPMGHCIAEVARRLQNGIAVTGVTNVNDLLEQGGQHTSSLGTYIGQLASYCVFFQQRPHGCAITNLSNCQAARFNIAPDVAAYMWDLVWDVVVNEPYTLVLPEGTDNIGAFTFPTFGTAAINGTNVSITVPYGTNLTALAPTFNVSPGATSVPPSGTARNFSTPQHYIVTSAGGATTKDFTVTVNIAPYEGPRIGVQRAGGLGGSGAQLLADQRAGAPGYKQINWNALASYASNVTALKDSAGNPTTAGFTCDAGGVSSNTGTGATPDEVLFTGSQYRTWGDWTFNITGIPYANYDLVFYVVGPGGRTQGVSLTGGPAYYIRQNFSPTAAGYVDGSALTPFNYLQGTATSAATATVDANYVVFSNLTGANKTVIIPGGFLITNSFNAFQIVDTSPPPGPQAMITRFDFGALGLATINGTAIALTVPNGTAVTALAPTFTLSSGATCNRVSGAVTDFTTPQSYIVTSSDSLITQTYNVTVTVIANTAPTVGGAANVTIQPGTASATLNLTLTDDGLPAASVPTLTATSSDTAILPNSALVLTGTGGARTLTITPPAGTSGTVTVSLIASDGALNSTTTFTLTILSSTVTAVCTSDAEESAAGTVTLAGQNLTLGASGIVGLRFTNLALPAGAIITSASLQLTAATTESGAATFDIAAHVAGNAPAFTAATHDLQNRAATSTSVLWTPGAFTAGTSYQSPDLTALLQSVVSRPDWATGNAVVLLIEGTGQRSVDALEKSGGQPARLTVNYAMPSPVLTLNATINNSANDAEQYTDGTVVISSSDLELVFDTATTGNQLVGMRFENITLSAGTKLKTAAIQFAADEVNTEATALTIRAQAADNAAVFSTTASSLSTRAKTTASAPWSPAAWNTIGERAAAQRTPDLTAVLSEVFTRPGWTSGNAVALFINGTGHRTADAFDDTAAGTQPAQLQLTYTAAPNPYSYLAWIAGQPAIPAAQRQHTADPDGDGYNNLLEFALALNPLTPSPSPLSLQGIPDFLVFTYTRPRVAQGLTYTTEWADNLTAWSAAGTTTRVIADDGTVQTINALIPAGTAGRRYVRLTVIQE